MKLLSETLQTVQTITEGTEKKSYFIEGVFAQAETKNKNGRIYPKHIMEREVMKYIQKHINESTSLGELGHPDTPAINLDRASHVIKELRFDGNDVYGKAKLMETPCGKIAKALIDEGVKLGVSTRGVGSLREHQGVQMVQEDFSLATVDIVSDPSAPSAYVQGVYEGAEWVFDPAHGWKSFQVAEQAREVIRSQEKITEQKALQLFNSFIKTLGR